MSRSRIAILVALVLASAGAFTLVARSGNEKNDRFGAASPPIERFEPLPDDDLTAPRDGAVTAARAVALRDARVRGLLEGRRWQIVLTRWTDDAPCSARCLNLSVYRYDDDALFEIFVQGSRVADVVRGSGQPPVSPPEQAVAHRIAESDEQVRDLLGAGHTHGALAYSLYPDEGPCARHRCATVIFMLGDFERTGNGRQLQVLVDLSARRVLSTLKQTCDRGCAPGW